MFNKMKSIYRQSPSEMTSHTEKNTLREVVSPTSLYNFSLRDDTSIDTRSKKKGPKDIQIPPNELKIHQSIARKVERLRKHKLGLTQKTIMQPQQIHQYVYRQFANEPKIDFSPFALAILPALLICVNISIARSYQIPLVQYIFYTSMVTFLYNLIWVLRPNHLMSFLPTDELDNKLKVTCMLNVIAAFLCLKFGWNATGGMVYAVVWEYLKGTKGTFYLIILLFIIAGSVLMEQTNSLTKLIYFIPSLIFAYNVNMVYTNFSKNSPYAIVNQMSLFLMVASAAEYPFFSLTPVSMWTYVILIGCGFLVYWTMLMLIKQIQTTRVSLSLAIMSGIIIIGTSQFEGIQSYVAFLMIGLSILVLLKTQYLDNEQR